MGNYKYLAKDLNGTRLRGMIQAENEESVYHKVRVSGYYVVWVKEIHKNIRKHPLSSGQLAQLCDQLAAMLGSGVPLARAMGILITKGKKGYMTELYRKIYELLIRGDSFSEALRAQNGVFPPLFIGMFRAGEEGGELAVSAIRLAEIYKKEDRLKKRIKTSMMYPVFLLLMTVASLILIFTMILPEFFDLFESLDSLPVTTRILMQISNTIVGYPLPIILTLTALAVIVTYMAQLLMVRSFIDYIVLKLPVVGRLLQIIGTARFARTLGILYANGLYLVQALEIAIGVIGNRYIENQLGAVIEAIKDGTELSVALHSVDGLESGIITSIFIGEESGKLDIMLGNAADNYEFEANEATARLVSLLEPVVILIMAAIIGTIMLSVMIPIYQYYETMGG